MKKLKEIPFNHELIGQTGIVIKYRNGKEPLQVVWLDKSKHTQPIISVPPDGENINREHFLNGMYYENQANSACDLIMYQEIEQKEPRVIWVNIYDNVLYATKDETMARESCAPSGETVKFIEVIEEGE